MSKDSKEFFEAARKMSRSSSGYSRKEHNEFAYVIANDPHYEQHTWSANNEGQPVDTVCHPTEEFRSATADCVAKTLSLDKEDREKIANDMEVSNKMAASIVNLADAIDGEYMNITGRKINLPTMSKDSAKSSIQMVDVDEKEKDTTKIENGQMVPTGNHVTTFKHSQVKAKATVYPWQKKIEKI